MNQRPLSFRPGLVAWLGCALFLAVAVVRAADGTQAPATTRDINHEQLKFFESKIRPVLVEQCYKCHSATSEKLKGGLRVDTRDALLKGGSSEQPAVVPGNVDKSLLIKAIRYTDEDMQMPPKHRLPPEQVADFEAWVKMGAPDPRVDSTQTTTGQGRSANAAPAPNSADAKAFWSFQPVKEPAVPAVKSADRCRNAVDRFIVARQEEKGIAPVVRADKLTLIRRATFDLTGLPPTPDEVDAFLADQSPDAFTKVVDRLLASSRYGERWGRHWLDLVRYADTAGESADFPVPQAYKYRDYVIAAFNADKPYDRFLREQIAGDLLPAKDDAERKEQTIATGYLAVARRFSVAPEREMHLTIDDTIDTLGRSVMGLTLGCARCHDHKFDPVTSKDYYALYGVFSSSRYPFPGSEERPFQLDMVVLDHSPETDAKLKPIQDRLAALDVDVKKFRKQQIKGDAAAKQEAERELDRLKQERKKLLADMPQVDTAYAMADAEAVADAPVLKRGEPSDKGEVVPRHFLTVLGGQMLPQDEKGSGRLELAQWLTDPANPLTARVMVNRIWQHHFGRGIVPTPSDFGSRGMRPTHPELLDYLASQFVKQGWSVKAMHRLIMLSETYQLASAPDDAIAQKDSAIDPTNELRWHFDRQRLEAEAIRDAMLAVSGDLDLSTGGPHPFPAMKDWRFTQHAAFSAVYETKRRSVYVMVQRIKRHPFFGTFDGADPNASTAQRMASTTPLQALYLMNDKFVHDRSDGLARRVLGGVTDDGQRVGLMYRLALSRPAGDEEVAAGQEYLRLYREQLKRANVPADQVDRQALASLARVLFASNEFVFVD